MLLLEVTSNNTKALHGDAATEVEFESPGRSPETLPVGFTQNSDIASSTMDDLGGRRCLTQSIGGGFQSRTLL